MDIYQEITNRIISQMEQGTIPWRKPWVSSGNRISYATGKPYSLLNQMLLGRPGEYLTFNECHKAGGYVRKGEKASMVVFWTWLQKEDEEMGNKEGAQTTSGEDTAVPQPRNCDAKAGQPTKKKDIPFLRYYNVFHIDQCEGLKARHAEELPNTANADETAETIIANYLYASGVKLEHQEGDRAYYRPSADAIVLPLLAQFHETTEYYSTAFHEMVHSTGHTSRLNRIEKTAFFGSEAYSKEELIAEISAATLVRVSEKPNPVLSNRG